MAMSVIGKTVVKNNGQKRKKAMNEEEMIGGSREP